MANPHSSVQVTDEELRAFHAIDRSLFTALIFPLGRDVDQSIHIMALWLWLERQTLGDSLVRPLLSLPLRLVDSICDETVLCFKAMELDDSLCGPLFGYFGVDIPLLQSMLRKDISLRFFHENRDIVLRGVGRIVNVVCARAFVDIVEYRRNASTLFYPGAISDNNIGVNPVVVRDANVVPPMLGPVAAEHVSGSRDHTPVVDDSNAYGFEASQRFMLPEQIEEFERSFVNMKGSEEEEDDVPVYERTIFLTFSKGYPISHHEVHDFFNGLFGDVIEAIQMQEVGEGEQALYAKLVVCNASMIQVILDGQSKVKFSINGKHAWARKYVRKNTPSPPRSPPCN
ncbi:hypothetical protein Droror1_Dr00023081 [Drosera rotundifolia]